MSRRLSGSALLSLSACAGIGLAAWDHAHLWHPFTQMADWLGEPPLIVAEAEGTTLIDTDGRRYLDGVSSLWCNVHGHRHPAAGHHHARR